LPRTFWTILPLATLLAAATSPLLFLIGRFVERPEIDVSSLATALAFAVSGAAVAVSIGGVLGAILGTREVPGRFAAIAATTTLVAAPPAFWWIGLTRLTASIGRTGGIAAASVLAGSVLAPISMLLVLAAMREVPRAAYEAARVSLGPGRRVFYVLVPFIRPAVLAGFLLTTIILLGESEIPFLFGFRTSMTDVVTTFSQTFDPRQTVPVVMPLIGAVLIVALLMVRPLFAVMLPGSRGGRGVVRNPAGGWAAVATFSLSAIGVLSVAGYARAALSGRGSGWSSMPVTPATVAVSIGEPLLCAFAAVAIAVLAAYPARGVRSARLFAVLGLLLFCVPAGLTAIGWIALGQTLGGVGVGPSVVHVTRMVGLAVLGFLMAHGRVPDSLEDAARLVPLSSVRRAWILNLPLVAASLAATAALIAALIFADRDVASLLLAPGESRMMLNLYLLSANAPSATIGLAALAVLAVGAVVIALAAAGPAVLLRATKT
jgi:ABC-type Fe3+ transport system permease subunit